MFELTKYFEKTKLLNKELIDSYGLEITLADKNTITLKNQYCKIEFATGRYYLDFHFFLTTTVDNKRYTAIELFEKENIIVKEILNEIEQYSAKNISDEIERYIYIYSIILRKKLTDYLIKHVD